MLALAWSFGFPARFADPGVAQTRCAQTICAFSPVPTALLDHTTRPEETAVTMRPFLMADQLATLRQGPPINESSRPKGRPAGVGAQDQERFPDAIVFWKLQLSVVPHTLTYFIICRRIRMVYSSSIHEL